MVTEKTACILCSRNCGLTLTVDGGKFTRIRGDDEHPLSKGYICQKAARLEHYQNHADRLSHPLQRQADGSLPNNGFARLVAGSDLIDKGVDVGLPFNGSAPMSNGPPGW